MTQEAVIGGDASTPAQDAVVALVNNDGQRSTGVVVAPTLVMTSRHALFAATDSGFLTCAMDGTGWPTEGIVDPTRFHIYVGSKKPLATEAKGKRVFSGQALDLCVNDIALLEVDTPLSVEPMAMRLAAPTARTVFKKEAGTLVGWGDTLDSAIPLRLGSTRQQLDLAVAEVGPQPFTLPNNEGTIQLLSGWFIAGQGGCYGDSGSPFIAAETGAVVGILSSIEFANPIDMRRQCVGAHSVFRSLKEQSDWIREAFVQAGQAPWLEDRAKPRAAGESCAVDDECVSGLCATAGGSQFCSAHCDREACPGDMQCVGTSGAQVCVPTRVMSTASRSASCGIARPARTDVPWLAVALVISLVSRRRQRHPIFDSETRQSLT